MYDDHPFLRLHSPNRADMLADAAHGLILAQGSAFVSQRALAERMDMTSAGLVHIFGGKKGLLEVLVARYGRRWLDWATRAIGWDGVTGALPTTPEELDGTTVWLAIRALGPTSPDASAHIARVDGEEREALVRVLVSGPHRDVLAAEAGRPAPAAMPAPDPADVDLLFAAILGLRHAVTRPSDPMAPDDAAAVLGRALDDLRRRQQAA